MKRSDAGSRKNRRKSGKVRWIMIYILAFLAAFAGSAAFKLKYDPTHGKYSVKWSDAVGTKLTDLPYGDGEANRFDLDLPAC